MTEKRKPTYDLEAFKTAFSTVERLNVSGTAIRSAAALGFGRAEIVATMQRGQFYKLMTSYGDHRIWQDVYHVPSSEGMLYVRFTVDTVAEFLLMSFKEKEEQP